MINFEALFKISYGLYIVSAGGKDHGNGFISNTVFQVTAEPPKFAACCSKNNYNAEFIQKNNAFAVSVLHKEASPDLFGRFGFRSGKDFNKLEGMHVIYGETGVPIVLNDCISYLECTACGFIYDEAAENIRFADLPAAWICPSCGLEKEDFMEIIP